MRSRFKTCAYLRHLAFVMRRVSETRVLGAPGASLSAWSWTFSRWCSHPTQISCPWQPFVSFQHPPAKGGLHSTSFQRLKGPKKMCTISTLVLTSTVLHALSDGHGVISFVPARGTTFWRVKVIKIISQSEASTWSHDPKIYLAYLNLEFLFDFSPDELSELFQLLWQGWVGQVSLDAILDTQLVKQWQAEVVVLK